MKTKEKNKFYYSKSDFIHYERYGHGATNLVFLHGYGSSVQNWYDIKDYFAAEVYTLHLLDLKGFGQSSVAEDEKYKLEDHAKIILQYINEQELKSYWLIGHSYGGGVVLYINYLLGQTENSQLQGSILIDSASYICKFPLFMKFFQIPLIDRFLYNITSAKFKAHQMVKTIFKNKDKITPKLIQRYAYNANGEKYPALKKTTKYLLEDNIDELTQSYKEIKTPVLVIWGDSDKILSVDLGKKLEQDIPNSKLQIIANCGHVPQEEYPKETAKKINAFLLDFK